MLHLSQNIKLIRGLCGKTQEEFAKIIGENLSNLKTYERTDVLPKVHIRKRIAAIAGVSIKDLLEKDLTEQDIRLKDDKDENAPTNAQEGQNGEIISPATETKPKDSLQTSTIKPDFGMKPTNGNQKDKDTIIESLEERMERVERQTKIIEDLVHLLVAKSIEKK